MQREGEDREPGVEQGDAPGPQRRGRRGGAGRRLPVHRLPNMPPGSVRRFSPEVHSVAEQPGGGGCATRGAGWGTGAPPPPPPHPPPLPAPPPHAPPPL